MEFIFLSSGDALRNFRKEQYVKQGGICPILKIQVPFEDTVVDHCHKTRAEELGVNGAGLIRGIIHNSANAAEGTITSIYKRRGLSKIISLPDYLRGLADYLENPPLLSLGIVHPNEKPKMATFGKREFNKVLKYWPKMYPKKKVPEWKEKLKKGKPTGKMNLTKNWEVWIKYANEWDDAN